MEFHQMSKRCRGRPSGKAIIADIDDAADPELAPDDIDNVAAVFLGDPGPDAVKRDDIELGQIGSRSQLGKRVVERGDVGSRRLSKRKGVSSLSRIEIGSPK